MSRLSLADRFWKRVEKGAPDECWLWNGQVNRLGYGTIGRGPARHDRAHRVSYELHFGLIPEGMHVLHSCDVRCCVNPAHLRLGTHAENMRDKAARGRVVAPRGEANHFAKLTDAQVAQIISRKAAGERTVALAREFGIDRTRIWQIARKGAR